jgi:hypothetical protein
MKALVAGRLAAWLEISAIASGHDRERRAIEECKDFLAAQDRCDVRHGQCSAEGKALNFATAKIAQKFCLRRRRDMLSNHVDAQRLRDSDYGFDHGPIRVVFQHVGDEITRDLDTIGTKQLHVGERGISRPKIVDACVRLSQLQSGPAADRMS